MGQITVQKDIDGIKGLCVIESDVYGDSRGYFMETQDMEAAGFNIIFVQYNHEY